MYNRTSINSLVGLVGFENPSNLDYKKVDSVNTGSTSGRYFTDNPYCKIEYLWETQDYKDISANKFNAFLTKIQKTAIMNVCDNVFTNSDLLEREMLYPYAQNKQNLETLPSGFVGYRIRKNGNVAFRINRLFVEFSNTGSFTLYLFSSNQPTALYSQEITVATVGLQNISLTNEWVVDNTTNYEGEYYLGYIKNGLIPYKRDYDNANIQAYFKHLCIEPIYVSNHSSATLFDLKDVDGMSENCGINPDITVYDDYTDWILNNKMILAEPIQTAGQIDIIRNIISTVRSNPTERITKAVTDKMIFELEGNPELRIYGLKSKYTNQIEKLKKSFGQQKGLKLITKE